METSERDDSVVVVASSFSAPLEDRKDNRTEQNDDNELAVELSSLVVTSSDTDTEVEAEKFPADDETEEDAAIEQVLEQQMSSPSHSFLEDRVLRFYGAINQFRIFSAQGNTGLASTKARAVAMSIMEMFVLPKSKLKVDLSPPVRKGLMVIHSKLAAFYQGTAYRSRPPRLAADVFERAAKEIRNQVRVRVEKLFEEKARQSQEFQQAASSNGSLDSMSEKFIEQEVMLIGAKRLLDSASLRGSADSLRANAGTIRFEVPHPKKKEEVAGEVDNAISDWLGGGKTTLRKVISLAGQNKEKKTVEELRVIARIESRVAHWQGPQARIAEQVDQWSAREAKDDLKKKQLSMRDKSEEARKKRPGRKDKWKKTM